MPTLASIVMRACLSVPSKQFSPTQTCLRTTHTGRRSTSTKLPTIQSSARRSQHFTDRLVPDLKSKVEIKDERSLRRAQLHASSFFLTLFPALRQDGLAS